MKVAVGLRRVAAGKRTSGRRAAQIANMIPGLHFFNGLPEVRLFRLIPRVHLHGCWYQVCVEKKGLPDDRIMPVLLRGPFLPVSAGQVDPKIIIRTVKKYAAEISFIVLFITMVKELNVFFVGSADKGQTVVNLVL